MSCHSALTAVIILEYFLSFIVAIFGSAGKEIAACIVGDLGWTPGLGRCLGEGKGNPLQYSTLENSMGCIAHGVAVLHNE